MRSHLKKQSNTERRHTRSQEQQTTRWRGKPRFGCGTRVLGQWSASLERGFATKKWPWWTRWQKGHVLQCTTSRLLQARIQHIWGILKKRMVKKKREKEMGVRIEWEKKGEGGRWRREKRTYKTNPMPQAHQAKIPAAYQRKSSGLELVLEEKDEEAARKYFSTRGPIL